MPKNISKNLCALNLANNYLTSLEGVEQFMSLEEICLKNNRIHKGTNLLPLGNMKKLSRIEIDGNPFLKEPLDEDVLDLIIEKETDI